MNWVPDRDRYEEEVRKGHVSPPTRNPVPEREEQQPPPDRSDDD